MKTQAEYKFCESGLDHGESCCSWSDPLQRGTYDYFRYLAMQNVISRSAKLSATQRRTSRRSKDEVPQPEVTFNKNYWDYKGEKPSLEWYKHIWVGPASYEESMRYSQRNLRLHNDIFSYSSNFKLCFLYILGMFSQPYLWGHGTRGDRRRRWQELWQPFHVKCIANACVTCKRIKNYMEYLFPFRALFVESTKWRMMCY
jgi:hypothetical protein